MRRFLSKRLRKRLSDGGGKTRRRLTFVAAISAFAATVGLRKVWRSAEEHRRREEESRDEQRVAALVGFCFVFAMACGAGLLVVYAMGGQVQLEGALLGGSLGGMGAGLMLWGNDLFPHEIVTEERDPMASGAAERAETGEMLSEAEADVTRRGFLTRLLVGAGGAFVVAMVFPLRSLGPSPGASLLRTKWSRGSLVVDENGVPVRHTDLPVGGVLTVFPKDHTDAEDSQAILVKVEEDRLHLPENRNRWAPGGNVCYSKICTHVGCPVGLYAAELRQLQCPCHQSAFDVTNGAKVVFGPAPRALPQLELYVDHDGFLRARRDFHEPVGPGWWTRPSEAGS
ncbi:MAG: ubiquinol-cytochrome c reductase iron-sulfur subunit [Actinomycetota bacterium]